MKKETKFAVFVYQKQDSQLIDELAEHLSSQAERIFDFFAVDIPLQKPTINIVPTKEEYDEIWKKAWGFDESYEVPKWSVGFSKNGEITYLSINDYKNTSHAFKRGQYQQALEYYKKTLVHEFAHYVNELFNIKYGCSYTAKYLREGIATYLSGQKDKEKISFSFSLDQILEKDVKKSCYAGWFMITKYFVENYDKDFVMQMFKSNQKATDFLTKELYQKAQDFYKQKSAISVTK